MSISREIGTEKFSEKPVADWKSLNSWHQGPPTLLDTGDSGTGPLSVGAIQGTAGCGAASLTPT